MIVWIVPLLLCAPVLSAGESLPEPPVIFNPYEEVEWEQWERHKGNLHAHSTVSDGRYHPHEVVDRYHEMGYSVLSISDHDRWGRPYLTYPWEEFENLSPSDLSRDRLEAGDLSGDDFAYESRFPEELGMVAIPGIELTRHPHIGSYFSSHSGTGTVIDSVEAIARADGLAVFFHPTRRGYTNYTSDWFVDLIRSHDVLVGLEVYNGTHPSDGPLWDAILAELMPERPVWGFSNTDSHRRSHGRNWNTFLLPDQSKTQVRRAMEAGRFYFVYSADGPDGTPPSIDRIEVDDVVGTIRIEASDSAKVEWVSGGEDLHVGDEIDLRTTVTKKGYVRARLQGEDGQSIAKTQPFGVSGPVRVDFEVLREDGGLAYLDEETVKGRLLIENLLNEAVTVTADRHWDQSTTTQTLNIPARGVVERKVPIATEVSHEAAELRVAVDCGPAFGPYGQIRQSFPVMMERRLDALEMSDGFQIFNRDDADVMVFETSVQEQDPLDARGESYLAVETRKREPGSEGSLRAGFRGPYEMPPGGAIDYTDPHAIEIQLRLDKATIDHPADRLQIWTSGTTHTSTIRFDQRAGWGIEARAYDRGRDSVHRIEWAFYTGNPDVHAEEIVVDVEDLSGAVGTVYDIRIEVDPGQNRWDVVISDGQNRVRASEKHGGERLRFFGDHAEARRNLHFTSNFRRTSGRRDFHYSIGHISALPLEFLPRDDATLAY